MVDILIVKDPNKDIFSVYEPTSETVIQSTNLTEALLNLDKFLKKNNYINSESSLLDFEDIRYHLDSKSMKGIIESNVKLVKRLKDIPSEMRNSQTKFGDTTSLSGKRKGKDFSRGTKGFQGGHFSSNGKDGFGGSYKKFGH